MRKANGLSILKTEKPLCTQGVHYFQFYSVYVYVHVPVHQSGSCLPLTFFLLEDV